MRFQVSECVSNLCFQVNYCLYVYNRLFSWIAVVIQFKIEFLQQYFSPHRQCNNLIHSFLNIFSITVIFHCALQIGFQLLPHLWQTFLVKSASSGFENPSDGWKIIITKTRNKFIFLSMLNLVLGQLQTRQFMSYLSFQVQTYISDTVKW